MRPRLTSARLAHVETKPADLSLMIQPGSEPITGQFRLPDGSTAPFEGYLELIAAIERVHNPGPDVRSAADRVAS